MANKKNEEINSIDTSLNITSNDNDYEQHNITEVAVSQISDETFRVSPKALMPPPPPLIWPQTAASFGNQMLWKQYTDTFSKLAPFLNKNPGPTELSQTESKIKKKTTKKNQTNVWSRH